MWVFFSSYPIFSYKGKSKFRQACCFKRKSKLKPFRTRRRLVAVSDSEYHVHDLSHTSRSGRANYAVYQEFSLCPCSKNRFGGHKGSVIQSRSKPLGVTF
jgi:hypothetical protein